MTVKAFRKLLRANLLSFMRDRSSLFFSFAFPAIFIVIFGAVFAGDQTPSYTIGLVQQAHSPAGDALATALLEMKAFKVHQGDATTELEKLKKGDRRAVVVVGAPGADGTVPVQVYADPAQTATQQILVPLIQQVASAVNQRFAPSAPAVRLEMRGIGVRDLRSIDYLTPGILAMALMQLGIFSAVPLVMLRETKVLRRLSVTPLRRSTMVAAQVVLRLIVAVGQAVVLLGGAVLLFHVRITGNIALLAGFIVLGALMFVAMGYALAGQARTAESVQPLLSLVQFPMLFLSGVFFPLELVPGPLRPLIEIVPLTYLGDALRQVSVKATPDFPLWVDAAVLGGWLAACLVVSMRTFRWE